MSFKFARLTSFYSNSTLYYHNCILEVNFTLLELWVAEARHNFKRVKIKILSLRVSRVVESCVVN